MTTFTATYSPDDNKLRLYASQRLDAETYAKAKALGFKWAPKQDLFFAPMWTPAREDFLIELAGEIEDEDKSLVDRAEERAERFEDYSDKRGAEAERARKAVAAIADGIPLGQPILVGHHSERRARKDAERIENGMRQAVKLWRTSTYWTARADGALRHAKYKELPAVRARRIKGIESDLRKATTNKLEAQARLRFWSLEGITIGQAKYFANHNSFNVAKKEGDAPGDFLRETAWGALDRLEKGEPSTLFAPRTLEEVIEQGRQLYPRVIARAERWIEHYQNRLAYERAMLAEAGGIATDQTKPEKGGAVKCWASHRGGWSYVHKVNRVTITVLDNWGNGGKNFPRNIELDKITGVMSAAQVAEAREAGRLHEASDGTGFFLSDAAPPVAKTEPAPVDDKAEAFRALEKAAKEGVKVVSAPQLFPTPVEIAEQMVALADVRPGARVLEPSFGTGRLLEAIGADALRVGIEVNPQLCEATRHNLKASFGAFLKNADFLEIDGPAAVVATSTPFDPEPVTIGQFDRILMNPPFENGVDVKHVEHALRFLKPGGRLVALCANGPRQGAAFERWQESPRVASATWRALPAGSFKESGTNVNVALVVIDAPPALAEAAE